MIPSTNKSDLIKGAVVIFTATLLMLFFLDIITADTTVTTKRVSSMKLLNEYTADSVEVRHLVLEEEDGRLSVMNHVELPVRAGQQLLFVHVEGGVIGLTIDSTILPSK